MRLGLVLFALSVVLLGGVLWWSSREPATPLQPRAAAEPSRVPSSERMNAVLSQQLAPARGTGTISGKVSAPGAIITATVPDRGPPLGELECPCEDRCPVPAFDCDSVEAAELFQSLVDDRRGEVVPVARTQAAADGTFTLAGLEPGKVEVWADDPTLGTALVSAVEVGTQDLQLSLGDGRLTFKGRVMLDARTPAAGAWVAALRDQQSRYFDVTAGPDGRFELGPLPEGRYVIVAGVAGRLTEHQRPSEENAFLLETPRTLTGTVTRARKPVGNVTVHLEGEHRRRDTVTQGDGTFAFPGLRPGTYQVTARHEGLAAQEKVFILVTQSAARLELSTIGHVHGTVRSAATTRPLAGVSVDADTEGDSQRIDTGVDGTYAFTVLSAPDVRMSIRHAGYLEVRTTAWLDGGDAQVDFSLRDEAVVSGLVVDATGAALEGASVQAIGLGEQGRNHATTDGAGTFDLHGLLPGDYTLRASHNDWSAAELEVRAPSSGAKLQLGKGATVTGAVVTRSGKPVIAHVWSEGADFSRQHSTDSGPDGRFTLTGVDEGPATIGVQKQAGPGPVVADGRKVIQVGPGLNEVRIEVDEVLAISGVLVTAEGTPVKGESVFANPRDVEARGESAYTDEKGAFEIEGLAPGEYEVSAGTLDAYAHAPARAGDRGVKLQLPVLTAVHGRVVSTSGQPLTAFMVDRRAFESETGEFEVRLQRRQDGRDRELQISAQDYLPVSRRVRLSGTQRLELGDIVLGQGTELEVHVVSPDGKPIEGAELWSRSRRSRANAVTGRDGVAKLRGIASDSASLTVEHRRYVSQEVPFTADEKTKTVVLSPGTVLIIRVKTSTGRTAAATVVAVNPSHGAESHIEQTDEKGEVRLEGLRPSRWQVSAAVRSGNDVLKAGEVIELTEPGERVLELKLPANSVTLDVTAALPAGRWSQGTALLVSAAFAEPKTSEELDDLASASLTEATMDPERAGHFVLTGVSPGRYRLAIRVTAVGVDTQTSYSVPLEVTAQAKQTVRVAAPASTY